MERKTLIWWGMVVGSIVGGYLPSIWGASILSLSGVFFTALGGILGIYIGYRFSE